MAFPTGWTKRCSLTIDNTKVSGSVDLSNFPVLLTEVNFPSTIFDNTQTTGADLRFTSDEAGTTELAFEIVNWDTTNDKAEIWVKIPTVDYDDDTVFYAWYGNASANAYAIDDTYGAENVWNSNYKGVWHLNETSSTHYDSTANDNDSIGVTVTAQGTAEGKWGVGADSFDGTDDVVTITENNTLDVNVTNTMSAWVKFSTIKGDIWNPFISKWKDSGENSRQYNFDGYQGKFRAQQASNGSDYPTATHQTSLSNGVWYQVVQRFNGSQIDTWVDGVKGTTPKLTSGNRYVTDKNLLFGAGDHYGQPRTFTECSLDEIRIMSDDMTDDWIATEYANQSAPATFVIEGTEEDVGNTSVTVTPDALALTSVIPEFTVTLPKNITVVTTVQSLTSSQPNCTVYPLAETTTANSVIYMANRDRIAIKLNDSGTVYWELD